MGISTHSIPATDPIALTKTLTRRNELQLAKRNDLSDLHNRFKKSGRVHIPNILAVESAENITETIAKDTRWNLVTNNNGRHLDLDAEGITALSNDDRIKFADAVHSQARWEFQYLFANYPIYDSYYSGRLQDGVLRRVFEFLNSPPFLDSIRAVTGDETINFADAQATKYEPGHFLTVHDDEVSGKNRCCAYVLNLTKEWRADWGGLLQFYDNNGHIVEAFTPVFNALNIFSVPQKHSVSAVAPFAGAPRYSITGWLRSGADPLGPLAAKN